MGASSRSPSPMTICPCMGIESIVRRMDSTATLSESSRSPRPMVRAEAIAAFSTTRINFGARSLSMFSPKLRALVSGFTEFCFSSVGIASSSDRAAGSLLVVINPQATSDYSANRCKQGSQDGRPSGRIRCGSMLPTRCDAEDATVDGPREG